MFGTIQQPTLSSKDPFSFVMPVLTGPTWILAALPNLIRNCNPTRPRLYSNPKDTIYRSCGTCLLRNTLPKIPQTAMPKPNIYLYGDNGEENGNYYSILEGLGFRGYSPPLRSKWPKVGNKLEEYQVRSDK